MGKVSIQRVTLQSFRAFQDRQSTNILPSTGLVGIKGYNRDTGGSSGAGKSTVALAVAYAFGFLPYPAIKQQNWHSKLPMQVELELETPQGPAVLRRGKEFSLTWNGKTVNSPAKAVEEAIQKMTGLPTDLLQTLTYRQQKKPGRFLTMKDSEKKEFLGTLLGTTELEEKVAEAVKKSNALQVEVDQRTKVIEALQANLSKPTPPTVLPYEDFELQLEEAKAVLAKLKEQEKLLVEQSIQAKTEASVFPAPDEPFIPPATKLEALSETLKEINRRIWVLTENDNEAKRVLWSSYEALVAKLALLDRQMFQRPSLQRQISALEVELQKLSEMRCPTCSQEWEGAEQKRADNEAAIQALMQQLERIKDIESEIDAKKLEQQEIKNKWATLRNPTLDQLAEAKNKVENAMLEEQRAADEARAKYDAAYQAKVDAFSQKHRTEVQRIERQLQELREGPLFRATNSVSSLFQEIELAKVRNASAQRTYEVLLNQYESTSAKIAKMVAERDVMQKTAHEEADFAAALKKYLGSLFDEVLIEISNETNLLLREIPNTPTTTVTFTSESVTKAGKVNQEIKPLILKNGKEIDYESGISGGQLESVELAIDLSIVKVIGERTGVSPGFMIFDESFAAHCLPVKQACLEVLKKAAQNSLILVIDHASELRDYFDTFIEVESDHDVSKFLE